MEAVLLWRMLLKVLLQRGKMEITSGHITVLSLSLSNHSFYLSTSALQCSCTDEESKIRVQTTCFYLLVPSSLLLKAREQKNIALLAILENASQVPDAFMTLHRGHRAFET